MDKTTTLKLKLKRERYLLHLQFFYILCQIFLQDVLNDDSRCVVCCFLSAGLSVGYIQHLSSLCRNEKPTLTLCFNLYINPHTVMVLALPVPWARFIWRPLTAIQTHTKKGKGYNEITIMKRNKTSVVTITIFFAFREFTSKYRFQLNERAPLYIQRPGR